MNPEQARIADGTIRRNRQTPCFSTRWDDHIAQARRERGFLLLAGMEAGEDEELYLRTPLPVAAV